MTENAIRQFLSPDVIAEILSVTVEDVYELLESGELFGLRVGKRGAWRIEESQLNQYIADGYELAARAARWNQAEMANIPELADGRII
jgi:excisionase family DNA binding protein